LFDNAWEYHQGLSEERLGRALKGKRDRAVVICTHGRDKSVAMRQLEESLTRLQSAIPRVHRTQRTFHSLANAFAQRSVRHGATKNLEVARGFQPLSATEMQSIRDACRSDAAEGHLELFKTTKKYDGDLGREMHGFPSSAELPL